MGLWHRPAVLHPDASLGRDDAPKWPQSPLPPPAKAAEGFSEHGHQKDPEKVEKERFVAGILFPAQQQPLPAPQLQSKSNKKEPRHNRGLQNLLQTPAEMKKILGRSAEH